MPGHVEGRKGVPGFGQQGQSAVALAAGDRALARTRLDDARRAFASLDMAWFDREAAALALQLGS